VRRLPNLVEWCLLALTGGMNTRWTAWSAFERSGIYAAGFLFSPGFDPDLIPFLQLRRLGQGGGLSPRVLNPRSIRCCWPRDVFPRWSGLTGVLQAAGMEEGSSGLLPLKLFPDPGGGRLGRAVTCSVVPGKMSFPWQQRRSVRALGYDALDGRSKLHKELRHAL